MTAVYNCFLLLSSFLLYEIQIDIAIPFQNKGVRDLRTIQSEFNKKGIIKQKEVSPMVHLQLKSKKQLSKWEIEELMNIRMPTFRRSKGGAMRSK